MKKSKLILLGLIFWLGTYKSIKAEARPIFIGRPIISTTVNGEHTEVKQIPAFKVKESECIITEENGRFFWATRGNKELTKHFSGEYLTFFAVDGAGYVRITDPQVLDFLDKAKMPGSKFNYAEHILFGLGSITYQGTIAK